MAPDTEAGAAAAAAAGNTTLTLKLTPSAPGAAAAEAAAANQQQHQEHHFNALVNTFGARRRGSRSNSSALAWNSPDDPIVGYGFEDSVAKTGALNFASLLTLEACATLCHAARGHAADETVAAHREATDALCVKAVSEEKSTLHLNLSTSMPFH